MIVYTVLVKEDDYETSKEYFGVFSNIENVKDSLLESYPDFSLYDLEVLGEDIRKTKYSLSKNYSRKYYHIFIYKDEIK